MPQYLKNKYGYYKKTLVVGRLPTGKPKYEVIRSKSLSEFKELVQQAENYRKQGFSFDAKK